MDIELASVTKRFGARAALSGIDLSIAHGERVALVGPNGSGKSTLLRALMGLVRVEGRLRLAGADPFAERERVARELAYVPQVAPRLGATVGEIVRTVCTLRDMDEAAVATLAARLELDLAPLARTPFATLSGGMKQKLLIALACARPASLSIFDEPTASLDAQTRARFEGLLAELTADGTVLLCTHRAEDVSRFATRVIELGEGRLVRDLRRAS